MRSNRVLILLCVGLAFAAIPVGANAAGKGTWALTGNAGYGIPTGEFGDFWDPAVNYGGGVEYFVDPQLAIGFDVSYMKLDPSSDYQTVIDLLTPGGTSEFTMLRYGANVKWNFVERSPKWFPYLTAGLSLYDVKENYTSPSFNEEGTQTALGPNGGAGFVYWAGPKLGLGVDALYHHPLTDDNKIGHDTTPYWSIGANVTFKLGGGAN